MNIRLQLCSKENKYVVNNIYPLYLHDLSEVWLRETNKYGVFEENDTRTLMEQNKIFDIWWEHPNILFPYLVTVDGLPAGFVFVASPPYTPCPAYINYFVNEFFLLRYYRGKGIGEEVMKQLLKLMPGHWELHTNASERNMRAISFWRKTLNACTKGQFTEEEGVREEGKMLIFRFNNNSDKV